MLGFPCLKQPLAQETIPGIKELSKPSSVSLAQFLDRDLTDGITDDLHDAGLSGTSPSSPTVTALQNRRRYNAIAPRLASGDDPVTNAQRSSFGDNAQSIGYSHHALLASVVPQNEHRGHKNKNLLTDKRGSALNLAHAPPIKRGIRLVCTWDLPDKMRMVFPYEVLNAVQSKCFPTAFETDDNLVVSAPTGSGKTVIMELAICRVLMQHRNTDFKVVYQAPTKSLCSERYQDWLKKFQILGLNCAELTGDTDFDHLRKVQQASIIITTPEKWDSVTRKWRDNFRLVQMIKLFLVDEVHILKDQRGATLEAVISRMKSLGTAVRFVALSATVPNSDDIATWLGRNSASPEMPARREVFDESFRPVPLEKHVYGFQYGSNDFGLDNILRKQVPDMIVRHSSKKPTMVFCMTRKSAVQTAQHLADFWTASPRPSQPWLAPKRAVAVDEPTLRKIVEAGVAFHHGGLSASDRHAVEQAFLRGDINVICSTSTLAVGVNLPCYLVVLQGTTTWMNNAVQSYSDLEIMQMLGRAGRPQFETSACAVILTREPHVARYQKMVSGQELLESTLHLNLIEHLNAEIGLGTISDITTAKRWLASTFLWVRIAKSPGHYRLEENLECMDADDLMNRLCEKDIQLLHECSMVSGDGRFKCTALGDAMARYYVKFDTMKTFLALPPRAKMSEILSCLSQAAEFSEMRLRGGEKSYYKDLNKSNEIMFPVSVDVALPCHKVSIILQSELAGASHSDGEIFKKHQQQHSMDRMVIFGHANRLMRCIIDCQIFLKDAVSVRNALELGRSIAARVWDNTPRQLKQLPDIGDVSCRKLASCGINSIEKLMSKEAHQIEMALGKSAPFGIKLLSKLESFPRLRISVKEMGREVRNGQGVTLKLKSEIGVMNTTIPTHFNKIPVCVCFLVEDSNGTLIDFRRFGARKLGNTEDILLTVHLDKPVHHIRCYILCDEIVGTCTYAELQVKDIPASAFPSSTKSAVLASSLRPSMRTEVLNDVFEDDGIDDEDLLAATNKTIPESISDVDRSLSVVDEDIAVHQRGKIGRTKASQNLEDQSSGWLEPTQLPNGKWTCQHLCRDKGVDCKHKCCREGVTRPKRKPELCISRTAEDFKQRKLTSMDRGTGNFSQTKDATLHNKIEAKPKDTVEALMARFRNNKTGVERPQTPPPNLEQASKELGEEEFDLSMNPDELNGVFDIDDDVWKPIDCDWTVGCEGHANSGPDSRAADHSPDYQLVASAEEAPQAHVSMHDILLDPNEPLFITGYSSSPAKAEHLPPAAVKIDASDIPELEADMGDFVLWDTIDNTLVAAASPDGDAPKQPVHQIIDHETKPAYHEDSQQHEDGKENTRTYKELDEHREKKLWEEDQARKWAEFPTWMREQFGHFADIID